MGRAWLVFVSAIAASIVGCGDATSAFFTGADAAAADSGVGGTGLGDAAPPSTGDAAVRAPDAQSSSGGGDSSDGAPPSSGCDPGAPFDSIAPVSELNTSAQEAAARMSPDELTVYISSDRGGTMVLYSSTRPSRAVAFPAPLLLEVQSAPAIAYYPTTTPDGLSLVFESIAVAGGYGHLVRSLRTKSSDPFGAPSTLTSLNSAYDDADPFVTLDGQTLYFASNRSGNYDLYQAPLDQGAPLRIDELSTPDLEGSPVLSADGRTLYYKEQRSGLSEDVWVAQRTTEGSFSLGVAVGELASTYRDWPSWLSPDSCRLYFISDRPGGAGNVDVWLASRSP